MSKQEIIFIIFSILATVTLFFISYLLLKKTLNRKKLNREPFPADWHKILCNNFEVYNYLPHDIRHKLRQKIKIFIAEKNFEGCNNLELTAFHKVIVAAAACLVVVNIKDDLYPYLNTIIIYPDIYQNNNEASAGKNVITETPHYVSGESWGTGSIVLAWNVCLKDCQNYGTGSNVIIHEFTHQLDAENGPTDGIPAIYNDKLLLEWETFFKKEFFHFRADGRHGHDVINDYGAVNAAEFYAVCTEKFFEQPAKFKRQHTQIYDEFKKFYNIDPASWQKE